MTAQIDLLHRQVQESTRNLTEESTKVTRSDQRVSIGQRCTCNSTYTHRNGNEGQWNCNASQSLAPGISMWPEGMSTVFCLQARKYFDMLNHKEEEV
jgi:hypothetical protein